MAHQCVRCGKLYEDKEINVLEGCPCGAKMFYYIKPEKLNSLKLEAEKKKKLNQKDREQIEEDVYDLLGNEIDRDKPIILDIECIEVIEPGKYNIDIVKLFNSKEPIVIKLEDGKYYVDLVENFERLKTKKIKKKEISKKKR